MQAKGDIIPDRKMRKQRIALKNHGNITFTGSNIINYPAAHFQLTAGNVFQTSDHSQRSSFAAAGRPQQNQALAFFYFQIQRLDDFSIAVRFTDIFKKLKDLNYTGMFLIEMWADNTKKQTMEEAVETIRQARLFVEDKMEQAGIKVPA